MKEISRTHFPGRFRPVWQSLTGPLTLAFDSSLWL